MSHCLPTRKPSKEKYCMSYWFQLILAVPVQVKQSLLQLPAITHLILTKQYWKCGKCDANQKCLPSKRILCLLLCVVSVAKHNFDSKGDQSLLFFSLVSSICSISRPDMRETKTRASKVTPSRLSRRSVLFQRENEWRPAPKPSTRHIMIGSKNEKST